MEEYSSRINRSANPDIDKKASYIHDVWKMEPRNKRKDSETEDEYIERQLFFINSIKNALEDNNKNNTIDVIISKLGLTKQEKEFKDKKELLNKEQKLLNDQIGYSSDEDIAGGKKTKRRKTRRNKSKKRKTKRRRYRK